MLRTILFLIGPFLLLTIPLQQANAKSTFWQSLSSPIMGETEAIGGYSNGCIIGAIALPLDSANYQVMRSNKNRFYGHPKLVTFIEEYTAKTNQENLGTILIGDMGMPAGGRFNGGHASHQSGLDVDIWLQLLQKRWSNEKLNNPQPIDLVSTNGQNIRKNVWNQDIFQMIKIAAEDTSVSRIFVNPAIKQQLCIEESSSPKNRTWLRKVRPWFQHRAHMHVRLTCPADNPDCENQAEPPAGDGCGSELASWFTPTKSGDNAKEDEDKVQPPLPQKCQNLIVQYQG